MKFDYVVLPVKNFQLTKTESKTRQPDDGHPADISLKNEKKTHPPDCPLVNGLSPPLGKY